MVNLRTLYMVLFIGISLVSSMHAEELKVFTEEFPPFNFNKDNKITGVSTEVVENIIKKSGMNYKLISYPWARTYELSQQEPNALIFSISRRSNREKLFKWIGIIVPSVQSVFALKKRDDIQVNTIEDLKKYVIGTSIKDARESYLFNKGFEKKNFQRVGGKKSHITNYKKLKVKRIDVWPMPNAVMNYTVRLHGDDPNQMIKKVFELSEISKGGYYIAASLQTSDEIVEKLKKILEEFKKTKEYEDILTKWGL